MFIVSAPFSHDQSRFVAVVVFLTLGSWALPFPCARADDLPPPIRARDLGRLDCHSLDSLFAAGRGDIAPIGLARGRVLLVVEARSPQGRARLMNSAWKGKFFYPDGEFVNRWCGFQAIRAQSCPGTSWFDGASCLVVDYPPGTPVFGGTRDEMREIAPGLILGRFYETSPCRKLKGYFVLEMDPCKGCDETCGAGHRRR